MLWLTVVIIQLIGEDRGASGRYGKGVVRLPDWTGVAPRPCVSRP